MEPSYQLTPDQVAFFKKNGYLHIRGLFTPEEVDSFRRGCQKNIPGDTAGRPDFREITLSLRMVSIMKTLLGPRVIYPGLSQTRTKDFPQAFGSRFFHEDAASDDYDFSKEYPIINTGIYLQDHVNFSGGLKIAPGSHRRPCATNKTFSSAAKDFFREVVKFRFKNAYNTLNLHRSTNVPSMPGDLILWNVRTHHSGYFVRPRFFPRLSLPPILENWIPSFLRLPDNPERDVILSIYAAPCDYLEKYIQIQMRKGFRKAHYLNSLLETPPVLEIANERGVEIRNDGFHYASDDRNTFSAGAQY